MRDTFLVFASPQIAQDEIDEVVASMEVGWLGTGPKVKQFEKDFAAYKQTPYTAALNSCTAGLHLCCAALDLQPGDEVITTAMTFCATVNAIIHSGATPVIVDIDPHTFNISPEAIARKITPKTRAIIPVHFAGRPCQMEEIMAIAEKNNLKVIEDCAHAIETEYKGKKAGTFGHFGVFSFYVTKNIITGEGGMVISEDEEKINRIKVLGLHGMTRHAWQRFSDAGYKHYFVEECGFKYNMMDLQAAIGIHQLKRVEQNWLRRQAIWQQYNEAFAHLPLHLPSPIPDHTRHGYHLYTILIDPQKTGMERDRFLDEMTARKIGIGVHYLSIAEHPYYQRTFGWQPEDYPQAMKVGRQTVSLPISPKLSDQDIADVINAVYDILKG
ncbi:MAG: DegT/DnrJ/EryC1/StrS family aminotransferase [Crocosphaera sp.]